MQSTARHVAQIVAAAEQAAEQLRAAAEERASERIAEARAAAREVLREGEELSGNLRELSDALRVNADRLLRDVRAAHDELKTRLDRVEPDRVAPAAGRERPAEGDLDVPEFIPRRR